MDIFLAFLSKSHYAGNLKVEMIFEYFVFMTVWKERAAGRVNSWIGISRVEESI